MTNQRRYFHLHLISDSTGETLIAASRAVASQYENTQPIEHVYPMIRNTHQLDAAISQIDDKPGIVLFTIADEEHARILLERCNELGTPCISILDPVFKAFKSYLGMPNIRKSGAQHELNAEYFSRIDAINFTLMHDDGLMPDNLDEADVLLLGISRTSKTPTAIYLANRGLKVANIPLVMDFKLPESVIEAKKPITVALIASTDRIFQVRRNRLLGNFPKGQQPAYVDRSSIAAELAMTRKLCAMHHWPIIDVTRKSIEETAAGIYSLWQERNNK